MLAFTFDARNTLPGGSQLLISLVWELSVLSRRPSDCPLGLAVGLREDRERDGW